MGIYLNKLSSFLTIFALSSVRNSSANVDLTNCEAPSLPPSWGSGMPGRYSVFIALDKCQNRAAVATSVSDPAQIPYEILPAALDAIFVETQIESIDIYAGEYGSCEPDFQKEKVVLALGAILKKLQQENITVNTLRLVGVPTQNAQLIFAVRQSVRLIMIQNCRPEVLQNSLAAVQGCNKLGTLLVYGPAEFKDLWRALYGKQEVIQIHLEQNSGSQDPFGMKELVKTLPKLTSVIFRCDGSCRSNFSEFAIYNGNRFKSMTIISFQSDNQRMDSAGVAVSKYLGSDFISLSLQGSNPIQCDNLAEIAKNMFLIEKTEDHPWTTVYLKVQSGCLDNQELWDLVQEKMGLNSSVEQCDHPLPDCRKVGFISLQLQQQRE